MALCGEREGETEGDRVKFAHATLNGDLECDDVFSCQGGGGAEVFPQFVNRRLW